MGNNEDRRLWTMKRRRRLIVVICGIAAFLCLALGMTALAEPKAYDLLLPDAAVRDYTEDEIRALPPQVITYAKNEIYALHGRKFVSQELTAWFNVQPWYYGTVEPEAFDPGVFNAYETANIAALEKAEQELGENAYTLDRAGWDTQVVDDYLSAQIAGGSSSESGIADGMEVRTVFSTDYFSFEIPAAWMEGAGYLCFPEADSISFCCQEAWDAAGPEDGNVCTILRQYEYVEPDYFPSASYLGTKNDSYFYLLYPTDVRYDPSNEFVAQRYSAMLEAADEIVTTFELK